MIAYMINKKKKLNPVVTELFITDRKLNIVFNIPSCFKVSKDVRPNFNTFLS